MLTTQSSISRLSPPTKKWTYFGHFYIPQILVIFVTWELQWSLSFSLWFFSIKNFHENHVCLSFLCCALFTCTTSLSLSLVMKIYRPITSYFLHPVQDRTERMNRVLFFFIFFLSKNKMSLLVSLSSFHIHGDQILCWFC